VRDIGYEVPAYPVDPLKFLGANVTVLGLVSLLQNYSLPGVVASFPGDSGLLRGERLGLEAIAETSRRVDVFVG